MHFFGFFGVLVILALSLNRSYQQGVCPQGTNCFWRYPYFLTKRLHCDVLSNNCRTGYMCCWDCHFSHPVCVRVTTAYPAIPPFGGYPQIPSFGNYPNYPNYPPQVPTFGNYPQIQPDGIFPAVVKKPVKLNRKEPITENNYVMNFLHQCRGKPNFVPNFNQICQKDNECPNYQFCSRMLKICLKISRDITSEVTFLTTTAQSPVSDKTEESLACPKDTERCNDNDVIYECDNDDDCLYFEVCCYSSCHKTKICKNKVRANIAASSCPLIDHNKNCDLQENEENTCNTNEDCSQGFTCCDNPCLNYKTCSPVTQKQTETGNCPNLEEKCTVPYSLRIANKFKCKEDTDCNLGQRCCEDPCIEYFKVCKRVFAEDNYSSQDFVSAIFKTANITDTE